MIFNLKINLFLFLIRIYFVDHSISWLTLKFNKYNFVLMQAFNAKCKYLFLSVIFNSARLRFVLKKFYIIFDTT